MGGRHRGFLHRVVRESFPDEVTVEESVWYLWRRSFRAEPGGSAKALIFLPLVNWLGKQLLKGTLFPFVSRCQKESQVKL